MILGIDTSSARGSAALVDNGRVVEEIVSETPSSFSRTLLDMIDSILSMRGGVGALGGMAVTTGPGSFTGIRIGIATIQGVTLSTGIPVFGVGTLDAMARASGGSDFTGPATVLVDAGKGNAYFADFDFLGGKPERRSPDGFAPLSELEQRAGKRAFFCDKGDRPRIGPLLSRECGVFHHSAAAGAAIRAEEQAASGEAGDVALLSSNYVQKSYAEKTFNNLREG
ncbi:MAG: tRNA (adenosine(37)-N6)-threonylcarbamoyltransferase complex dimerization subunit type 1 TsaB [Nitrospinae bacterium]|nr:tRNA (adenosine(37)-N6)-threonylcarbamoyltransferase complex dimerization subunit type 1 TsaB [Nitrospinota bacterium]